MMNDTIENFDIQIGDYRFDPLSNYPNITQDLRTEDELNEMRYIIQFAKSLTREDQQRIKTEYGLQLKDYLPNFAYLEYLLIDTISEISKDELFRAVIPYHPAFKIQPDLMQKIYKPKNENPTRGDRLIVQLHSGADAKSVFNKLYNMGFTRGMIDQEVIADDVSIGCTLQDKDDLAKIAKIKEVSSICEIGQITMDNGTTAGTIQSGIPGATPLWDVGIHGENQIIGIMDVLVDINHCFFKDNDGNAVGPTHRKVIGYRKKDDSTLGSVYHGTFSTGIALGNDVNNSGGHPDRGMAWNAKMTFTDKFLRTQDDVSKTMFALLKAAMADGAFVHSISWHEFLRESSPQYTGIAYDVDRFVWENEDNLVVSSASQSGKKLGPPGSAKNSLSVSAAKRHPKEMELGDGALGPTVDGRRKPDLTAPGCSIASSMPNTMCDVPLIDVCATSWATPAISGAAALARQYYMEGFYPTGSLNLPDRLIPSGALLKATLLNSTIEMTGSSGYPNFEQGWGLIRLDRTLYLSGGLRKLQVWDVRNKNGLSTGETHTYKTNVSAMSRPLKVTLVFTDPPPANINIPFPVVNNLDLKVINPDGTRTFLGNVFSGGVSVTGGTADRLNNVEMVVVPNPVLGFWSIEVTGAAVNVGAPGQGYALVATSASDVTKK